MSIDIITEYILAITPALTAIISIISSIVILIKRTKTTNEEHSKELKHATDEMNRLYETFYSVLEQNRQLNESLTEVTKQNKQLMKGMALKEDGEEEERI